MNNRYVDSQVKEITWMIIQNTWKQGFYQCKGYKSLKNRYDGKTTSGNTRKREKY